MNLEEKRYDAFISYRHKDLDQYVAVTLHKELEAFRIPRNTYKLLDSMGIKKRRIERVFRDRDELPITNNLADPITNALQNSEYLLVICTPRLPESIWCKTEVETFIKMHGRQRVFAVLAEGEPEDSFPEALLHDEEGNPIEPLAADVRGANKKEIHKKIREEVVRMAAPMFNLSYDDLKQRHREQKIRRTIMVSAAAAIVCGAFAVVSTTSALMIGRQAAKIKEQSAKIEEQYNEALYRNASSMAKDALELYGKGYVQEAIDESVLAVNGTDDSEMPYNPDAMYALSESSEAYRVGEFYVPNRVIECNGNVSFVKNSPDRDRLLAVDIFGGILVYSEPDDEVIFEKQLEGYCSYLKENDVVFIDNSHLVCPGKNTAIVIDIESGEEKQLAVPDAENGIYTYISTIKSNDGKSFAVVYFDELCFYDASSYEMLGSVRGPEGRNFSESATYLKDDSVYAQETYALNKKSTVLLIDTESYETTEYTPYADSVTDITADDNHFYVATYLSEGYKVEEGYIEKVTPQGDMSGKTGLGSVIVDKVRLFSEEAGGNIVYRTTSVVGAINKSTMELINSTDYGTRVAMFAVASGTESIHSVLRNGEYHVYTPSLDNDYLMRRVKIASQDIEYCITIGDTFITNDYSSNCLTVHRSTIGSDVETVIDEKISGGAIATAEDGSKIAVYKYGDEKVLNVYDTSDYGLICSTTVDGYNVRPVFVGDKALVLCDSIVYDMNLSDGSLTQIADIDKITDNSLTGDSIIAENGYVATKDNLKLYVVDSLKGKLVGSIDISERSVSNVDMSMDWAGTKVAYMEEDGISVYDISTGKSKKYSANSNIIDSICLSGSGELLVINYIGDRTEIHDADTLENIATSQDYKGGIVDIYKTKNDEWVASDKEDTFILDAEYNRIGRFDRYAMYMPDSDKYIVFGEFGVYEVPRYSKEGLLKLCKQDN